MPREGMIGMLAWVAGYGRRFPRQTLALIALMLGSILLNALKPWPTVIIIDYALRAKPLPAWLAASLGPLTGTSPHAIVAWGVLSTLLLFVAEWALALATSFAGVSLSQRMSFALAGDLFRHMQRLSLRFHVSRSAGDMIKRVTADCVNATTLFRDVLLPLLEASGNLLLMFGIMLAISPPLTLVALLAVPAMIWISQRYSQPMLERSYATNSAEGEVYTAVERTFAAIPVVVAFQQEDRHRSSFREATAKVMTAAISLLKVELKFSAGMGFVTALATAGIFLVGGSAAIAGSLSVGTIVLFLTYLTALYAPLQTIISSGATVQSAAGSVQRIFEILHTEPEVRDVPGARVLPAGAGRVEFEDVSFAYDPAMPVLEGITLTAEPGETIALVGATGAGKSTLVGLIPRFFDPTAGRVLIGGHDVRQVQLASLRRQVSLVLQEPFLFPVSIAQNIAYGRPDATSGEIEQAARAACIHDFVTRLPQGYDTRVGERGATLSGGERQRISIARALLKDAPILILDEPTAALDAQTEALIMQAMDTLVAGRTTFVIAHRLSTVRNASRIAVLEGGRIRETGTHEELTRQDGLYAKLTSLQLV